MEQIMYSFLLIFLTLISATAVLFTSVYYKEIIKRRENVIKVENEIDNFIKKQRDSLNNLKSMLLEKYKEDFHLNDFHKIQTLLLQTNNIFKTDKGFSYIELKNNQKKVWKEICEIFNKTIEKKIYNEATKYSFKRYQEPFVDSDQIILMLIENLELHKKHLENASKNKLKTIISEIKR